MEDLYYFLTPQNMWYMELFHSTVQLEIVKRYLTYFLIFLMGMKNTHEEEVCLPIGQLNYPSFFNICHLCE